MCQVDEEGISLLEKKPSFGASSRDCMKCGDRAVVIARIKDAFCRSCFLTYFVHRFRATFGKAKVIRDGDKVLLAFSGGQCSSAMVSLVKRGLDQSTHKKLRFTPALIYIDEGVVTGQSKEERATTCQKISDIMKETGFPWYIASLEEALEIPAQNSSPDTCQAGSSFHSNQDPNTDELAGKLEGLCLETEHTQRCRDLLASAKSLTAKQDLVSNLRNRLLVHKARQLGYHKVAVGDSGTRLSSGILANLAKGRGASIPVAMAFADDRWSDVTILRPMREFTTKEIVMYNALFNVDSLFQPTLATMAGDYASIDTLTETFINELQTNFPSTVSTVFRTGEKMCTAGSDDPDAVRRCSMCKSALDTSVGISSALSATRFSLHISRKEGSSTNENSCKATKPDDATCTDSSSEQCCGQGDGSCHSNQMKSVSAESLSKTLCYGCQVTVRDMDLNLLPSYIVEESAKIERRSRMRDEIKDFLLCEES
ncbi:cytoplasmic tRNA 2-thiolation protein 2-like isoform X2 [Patiria miniata]|uniref:Cytoplasmic tRNA 2-thiolation protein 2 n=1 Tax=Patiria miniata TaxID=46514 RepID=A0A914AXP3_PATMI|nr:cytoplasmic tRNA 2-thiolation protein 2-like isoform X2 [Patiria miniata]